MATYAPLVLGTPITWSTSGTYTLTLTSLASTSARQGQKSATLVDATKGLPALLEIVITTKLAIATSTDGTTVDVYVGFSSSATAGTDNPAGLTGADAALSSPASVTPQLVFVGSLICSNALGTGTQSQRFLVAPMDAYMTVAVVNNSTQALSSTAGDHVITVTPMYQQTS